MFTKRIVKLAGSVDTAVQDTVFCPSVEKPVELLGSVTSRARAEVARARTIAKARIVKD